MVADELEHHRRAADDGEGLVHRDIQIVKQFGGALALDTVVINGGHIAIGDPVEFVDDSEDVSIENPEQIVDMNN